MSKNGAFCCIFAKISQFFLVFAENSRISIDADLEIMLGFKQFKGVIVDE